jgi:plastocyanin
MQRVIAFLIVGIALAGVVLFGSNRANAADAKPAPVVVKIDNFSFGPASLTVAVGTEITWINDDDIPHTVTSEDKTTFKSHALDTNDKFTFKFDKPGTYTYFCSIHPKMTAKVVVQ